MMLQTTESYSKAQQLTLNAPVYNRLVFIYPLVCSTQAFSLVEENRYDYVRRVNVWTIFRCSWGGIDFIMQVRASSIEEAKCHVPKEAKRQQYQRRQILSLKISSLDARRQLKNSTEHLLVFDVRRGFQIFFYPNFGSKPHKLITFTRKFSPRVQWDWVMNCSPWDIFLHEIHFFDV